MMKAFIRLAELLIVCLAKQQTATSKSKDPLRFPKDNYTVETKTVRTSSGEKKVTYRLMNARYFTGQNHRGCAVHWWLRNGTSDPHTSQTVMVNLATSLENLGKDVNVFVFWDGGHCADYDPEGFIKWIGEITSY